MLKGLRSALVCAFAIAALSTFGDFVWARWIPEHLPLFGLAHGLVLGAAIGLVLGMVRGRVAKGALLGALNVLVAAGGYYGLRPILGTSAMLVLWMALWAAFGLLWGRWLGPHYSLGESLARGGLAAVGSGLGFYAISGIWTRFDPKAIDYAHHLACWTIAFAPAFLALLLPGQPQKRNVPSSP
jgi:hypothetical protein